ncbi:MAG: TRAP transporter substrate-binding protein [Proteobacteria bacterium]|nr:TRAP transporter substrate-binding protein [Pseudomonadota bacterium]MCP4918257.1 TRAP transporter substrate-binding protein [Pseudomonadota bacterium]
MKRRDFMRSALGFGVGGVAGLAACNQPDATGDGPAVATQKNIRWRLASSFPRSLDTLFGGAEVLAARVSAMTDGAFDIKVYPAGELVPGLQVMDAVQQGTVQIGQSASYYYTGKNPALAFDTCVPFGLTARQQAAWLLEGGGLDLMNEMFSDFGMRTFPGGNTGVQMGGWFNREVSGLSDLSGLKMRIPGAGGDVMAMLGVSVQVIAGGEIYPALERGAIDATEWVGPYDDEKLGFHKVVKNYYYPGWWEPGPSLSFYVGDKAWAELPASYQAIFQTACAEAAAVMQQRYDAKNPPALQRLLASGVQMRPFSDEIMQGARDASQQYLEDNAAADPGYKKVYDAFAKIRKDQQTWFGTAERAYHQFVSS